MRREVNGSWKLTFELRGRVTVNAVVYARYPRILTQPGRLVWDDTAERNGDWNDHASTPTTRTSIELLYGTERGLSE